MEGIVHVKPVDIEKESFAIIERELGERKIILPSDEKPVTMRVIHTTADFEYADTLVFAEDAVRIAEKLLTEGCDIVTDTNMAKAGISEKTLKRFGGEVHCFMADPEVGKKARERGVTRASVSMERAAALPKPCIFAIGNAPTALIRLHELMEETGFRPAFVIGVPVGFVNVIAAKELFLSDTGDMHVPYIINRGRKGGSTVAAAICNALLYKAAGRR